MAMAASVNVVAALDQRRRRRRRCLCFGAVVATATAVVQYSVLLIIIIVNIGVPMTVATGSSSSSSSSRAYPLGCLHRHPSYYTYDEREEILFPSNNAAVAVDNASVANHDTVNELVLDHVDFRTLPNKSSKLRHNYNQYRLIRQLGSGKFSEVFEAVDIRREVQLRRKQRRRENELQQLRQRQRSNQVVVQSERRIDDDTTRRKRKKKVHIVGTATATTDDEEEDETTESFIEDDDNDNTQSKQADDNNEDQVDMNNSLVVLKCLKPISERKIRRELLVLTHCNTLPNVARLIGIILPKSMDENDANDNADTGGSNNNDDPANERKENASSSSSTSTASSTSQSSTTRTDKRTSRVPDKKQFGMQNHHQHQQQLPALVLEHAGPNSQWLCHNAPQQQQHQPAYLTEHEIKYYLCHLLIALDGLHAAGIMHRDVKPRNMLINRRPLPRKMHHDSHENYDDDSYLPNCGTDDDDSNSYDNEDEFSTRQFVNQSPSHLPPIPLMLVDLGLADFYHPHKSYNVRVASRHYKSPELLIGYDKYDYSIDLWAVGCILAGLLFRKEPFFRGKDNDDQLGRIVSVLGVQDFLWYRRKCGVRMSAGARAAIGKYCLKATATSISSSMTPSPLSFSSSSSSSSEDEDVQSVLNSGMRFRKPWHTFVSPNCPIPSPAGLDLLDKLLVYDHEQRWTAREALNHEFFDDVREQVLDEVRIRMEWEERSRRKKQQQSLSNTSFGGRRRKRR